MVYSRLRVACPLHFWQNDRGLFYATAVTRGVERTPNKSQHTVLTLEKKIILPRAPAGFRTRNLSITSPTLLPTSYPGTSGQKRTAPNHRLA